MTAIRTRGSVPWLAISSLFHPAPTPNSNRPPDMKSTEATSLAVMIGSRSITRHTPDPTRSRLVAASAAVPAGQRPPARPWRLPARWDMRVLGKEQRLVPALLGQPRHLGGRDRIMGRENSYTGLHNPKPYDALN